MILAHLFLIEEAELLLKEVPTVFGFEAWLKNQKHGSSACAECCLPILNQTKKE